MLGNVLFVAFLALLFTGSDRTQDGLPAHAMQEDLLPAPYQVEGMVQFRDDRWVGGKGLSLDPPLVMVDVGAVRDAPVPTRESLEAVTIVGTRGAAVGRVGEIGQRCVYLCGEDKGEECHYVAEVSLAPTDLGAIGTPLVALPGEHSIEAFGIPASDPLSGDSLRAAALAGRVLTELAWDPYPDSGLSTRVVGWSEDATRVELTARWRSGDTFEATGYDCALRRVGELTETSCAGLALILDGATPLLLSYPDYNTASAEIVASFRYGGRTYFVVLLGLKAQNAIGLLVRTGKGWKGLFRPRDYALLC